MGYRFRVLCTDPDRVVSEMDHAISIEMDGSVYYGFEYLPNARILISTGIFDDDGVEVFEGDLLEIERRATMFWCKPNWTQVYRVDCMADFVAMSRQSGWVSCRIIGNIATKPK